MKSTYVTSNKENIISVHNRVYFFIMKNEILSIFSESIVENEKGIRTSWKGQMIKKNSWI